MVAIFTGAGAGFERSSANILGGNVLGGAGQLGAALLGRGGESVSVNAATGNLLIARQDEFLIGRGPDIGISRSYNSIADAGDGDNGDNWQQSTTRRVFGLTGTLNGAGSTVSRQGGDGSVIVYHWDATASAYITADGAGAFDRLEESGGVWTWTDGDSRITETYVQHGSGNWRITGQADIDGNALTFAYDGDKLDTVTTADGGWTQYVWSGNSIAEIATGFTDLETSSAQTLTRVRYGYDANNRLQTVSVDLSPQDGSVADGEAYVTTYTYDGASNRVASIGQTDGSLLAIGYDGQGRVATLTQTVAGGQTRVTGLYYGTGYTQVTGPDGQATRLDYDSAGQLTGITAPPAAVGATAQETGFGYDTLGNLVSVTDGNGKVTTYSHDAAGNITSVTDANGNTVSRSYDAANRLVTEQRQGADEGAASAAHYTRYAYDAEGHLRFAVDAAGEIAEYEYDAAGQLLRTILDPEHRHPVGATPLDATALETLVAGFSDRSGLRITENAYDARGNLLSVTAYGAADLSGQPLTTEGASITLYVYDQAGRLIERNRQGEQPETFVYDGMGRLVASSDVDGGTTTILFDDASTTTTITTGAGLSTVSVFDKAGELVSRTESGAHTSGGTAAYAYDAAGRLRMVTDASGRQTYFHYDKAGRKVAEINHLGEIVEYRYDGANRVIATISHATALDAAALATLANPDNGVDLSTLLPAASPDDVWNWVIYDDGGRLIETIGNSGDVVVHEYDQSDRLIRTTAFATHLGATQLAALRVAPPAAQVLPANDPADAMSRLFHDAAGHVIGSLNGEGYLTETVFDSAGLEIRQIAYATPVPVAVRAESFADLRSAVAGASNFDRTSYSVYDGQGLLRFSIDALGGTSGFEYDVAGRLTTTTAYAKPLILSPASDLTYDAVKTAVTTGADDRIDYTVYGESGRAAYTIDAEGGVTAYSYDTQGRVIKTVVFDNPDVVASLPSLVAMEAWAADPAQAGDTANRVTRSFYSERGELLYGVDAGGFVTSFAYDADGRVISRTAWGGSGVIATDATAIGDFATLLAGVQETITVSTTYDNAGRVLTVTDGEGVVTRNRYNALGQLTDVHVADGTAQETVTHYDYDAAGRIAEQFSAYGSPDQISAQFSYDGLGNRTAVTDANGNVTAYGYDLLGRVTTITDAASGVTGFTYDAFGNVLKTTDPLGKASFSYYDRMNRVVAQRDAEGYVTRTTYDRFGEAVLAERYAAAMTEPGEAGVAVFDAADLPPVITDPFDYAAQLQVLATDLDGQADAAEAAVPGAVQAAADAAQAASDADDVVDDIEAQIAALGGGGAIDFEAERTAALADMNTWLLSRRNWLSAAENDVHDLARHAHGLEEDHLDFFEDLLDGDADTVASLKNLDGSPGNLAKKAAYINQYYDVLTWRLANLGTDRAAALANPLTWLQNRKEDLENWHDLYADDSQGHDKENPARSVENLWADISIAAYDLLNDTYSEDWPESHGAIADWYEDVQDNPNFVPNGIDHTSQHAADYRASIFINAYFDVYDEVGYEGGSSPLQPLQAQLAQAQADAAAAHDAADAAQTASAAAQASATDLRAQADLAQVDADTALAAAQAGTLGANQDAYVLLDPAELGTPARTFFVYDRLGRTVQKVDAEGYVETYSYNAFGQLSDVSRYEKSIYFFDEENLPPDVQAAKDAAEGLQRDANGLFADAAEKTTLADYKEQEDLPPLQAAKQTANAAYNAGMSLKTSLANQIANDPVKAAFANPMPYLEATRDYLIQQGDDAYDLYVQTGSYEYILIMQDCYAQQTAVEDEIDSYLAGNPLSEFGENIVLGGAGLTQADATAYEQLQVDYDAAVDALPGLQAAASAAASAVTNMQNAIAALRTDAAARFTQAGLKQHDADVAKAYYEDLKAQLIGGGRELPEFEPGELGSEAGTLFAYDNRGQLVRTTDAEDFYETYGYDAFGHRISMTAKSSTAAIAAGGTTTYSYDKRGLLISETLPVQSYNTSGTVTGAIANFYEYDLRGNLVRRTEAAGLGEERVTEYEYDNLDRLTLTRHEAVTGVSINTSTQAVSSVSGNPVETIAYDANGNVIETVDAAGAKTVFFYDALDRKTVEIDAAGTYTAYAYDANGNVSDILIYANAVNLPATGGMDAQAPGAPSGAKRETAFVYDDLGRMISSTVKLPSGSKTGQWNGVVWTNETTTALTTNYEYDHFGNVVKVTDPNGMATHSYYDRLGRMIRRIDAEGYHTAWTYNSEGNVLTETRHAAKGYVPSGMQTMPVVEDDPANDRVTVYTYDLNGNRLTETRRNVKVHNGNGDHATADSTITYAYNGLGQVVLKTEATDDDISYVYDAGGRLTSETRETFASYNGQSVTPQADYFYDGLGNLVRAAEAGGGGVAAHVTRYEYGADGRLSKVTDAAGNAREYLYDLAGRVVLEHYDRTVTNTSGGTSIVHEGIGYRYDAVGRNLGQGYYAGSGSNWNFQSANDYTTLRYDAFGEITGIATNRSASQIASKGWQMENRYDLAGRLIASNAGDGLWKYFGYDKAGNRTITIATGGADLAGKTFAQAFGIVGQEGVNGTYVQYNARNLVTKMVEEGRQLSDTSTVDLTTQRSYNAFGEVASETDALGYTTDFIYNAMGRLIEKKSPQVSVTSESGVASNVRPTEKYYYDASGRLVAQRDANNNLTKLSLLAGTGYDGGEALVAQVIQPGTAAVTTQYDVHGNARKITDQIGRVTNQTFDAMGRVLTVARQGASVQSYEYDQLGRQVKHWNDVYGSGDAEITKFDIQGRIVGTREMGGEVAATSYAWNDTTATSTIGNFGGWITTLDMEGYDRIIAADLFGREAGADFTYDAAGRLTVDEDDINEPGTIEYQYYNTGNIKYKHAHRSVFNALYTDQYNQEGGYDTDSKEVWFSYDAMGRLKTEKLVNSRSEWTDYEWMGPQYGPFWDAITRYGTYQDSTATYDALGRLTRLVDAGDMAGSLDKQWTYDANGNIRSVDTDYRKLNTDGSFATALTTSVEWYRYDALNRVTLAKGDLSGSAIVRGADGVEMTYDAAGQRMTSQTGSAAKEYYTYNALGLVTEVRLGSSSGNARVTSSYDALGRLNGHIERDASSNVLYERFSITYNSRNQVLSEKGRVKQGANWVYSHTVNYYTDTGHNSGATDPALIGGPNDIGTSSGAVLAFSRTKNWLNGSVVTGTGTPAYSSSADTAMTDSADEYWYTYDDDKGFLQTVDITTNQWGTGNSQTTYDTEGNILNADRSVGSYGANQNVRFVTDAYGQVIDRHEYDDLEPWSTDVLPRTHTYRFGGREMGVVSNDGTDNVDYATLIARRGTTGAGSFRNGATTATQYADFDANHVTMANGAQADTPGSYMVRGGETLQGIALAVWGDAQLWYKLAEANGLSGSQPLQAGQRLVIPNGVSGIHNNADTLRPYDPSRALGDISPPHASPPKAADGGCGFVGQLLVAIVSIAVTVIAPIGGPGMLAQVGNGLLGNVAGQVVGNATGVQDGFSFKSLGISALSAGLSPGGSSNIAANIAGNAAANAAVQGIAVATGLQDKFNWAGVAAAGAGAGFGTLVGNALDGKTILGQKVEAGSFGHRAISATAGGVASAATRSALTGESFGDSLGQMLPNIIGQTVGIALGEKLAGAGNVTQGDTGGILGFMEGALELPRQVVGTVGNTVAAALSGNRSSKASAEQPLSRGRVDEGALAEIVVRADPHMHQLLTQMTDYQFWNGYYRVVGDHTGDIYRDAAHLQAHRALEMDDPVVSTLLLNVPDVPVSDYNWSDGRSLTSASPESLLGSIWSGAEREANAITPLQENFLPFGLAQPMAAFSGAVRGSVDHFYPNRSDLFTEQYRQEYNNAHPIFQRIPSHDIMNMLRAMALETVLTGRVGGFAVSSAPRTSVEKLFEQNSLRLADEAHEVFMRGLETGDVVLKPALSMEIQRGGFVDEFIRRGNLELRDQLGLDATAVRINQRLYTPDGRYTVPDIHFPSTGNSIDYSYALKTVKTRQIIHIHQASPHGNISIVPPTAIRPVYMIGF